VREGACGKRAAPTPKPRPQAYLTLHTRSGSSLSCPHPALQQITGPYHRKTETERGLDKHRSIDLKLFELITICTLVTLRDREEP
jgi:hypothetical protein